MSPEARRSLIDRRLFSLKPETLREYMTARGWRDYPHRYIPLMAHDDVRSDDTGKVIPLMVPPDNRDGDLSQRTIELLRGLSDVEGRPAMEILEDMLALQAAGPAVPVVNGANGVHPAPAAQPAP